MHDVVPASTDQAVQRQQRRQLCIAGHPQITHQVPATADHLRYRARVIQRHHVALMPGVLKERLQLQLSTADTQTRDYLQDFHSPPFMVRLAPATVARVLARITTSSQSDQLSM